MKSRIKVKKSVFLNYIFKRDCVRAVNYPYHLEDSLDVFTASIIRAIVLIKAVYGISETSVNLYETHGAVSQKNI
jgi:hypothetical protein